jgi:alkanesulfonate monooxygenase SsuD/methylene tetrahydromethanopterin reductase-like flavin-dependent oxidoreductase (luciferase family)
MSVANGSLAARSAAVAAAGGDGCEDAAVQVGLVLPLFATSWPRVRETALRAEAAGFDDVWVSDHLVGIPDAETPVLEAWSTLVALAEATDTIGLGSLVLSATFRPPRVLAKMVQTLAEMAGDRLTLGLGAGWLEREHRAFGLPFGSLRERAAVLEETIDAVRALAPDVPVLVGGAGQRMRALAAARADWWNAPGDRLDELPGLAAAFAAERTAAARPVGIVSRVGLLLAPSVEEAEARLARRSSPWARVGLGPLGLVGDPDEIVRRIGLHRDLGVTRMVVGLSGRDVEHGVLERFAEQVLSRVRR